MDRKWKSGAAVSAPTLDNASDGFATAGNPGTGTPATKPGPHWYHMVTEELLAFIAAAGVAFDKTVVTQLRDAAALLFDTQGVPPGGRLTLTTGVSVTTTDVTAATTVRYTPHEHDRIKLYDGTRWKWYTFTELSQTLADTTKSPAASAASKNYDMFVWDDSGTVRCTRGPLWDTGGGSNTARGTGAGSTELEFFGGRWVNKNAITNGPAARRGLFVGTIGTTSANQVEDSREKRLVWQMYNAMPRPMRRVDTTNSWTYTGLYRQANASAANQLEIVAGLIRDQVKVKVVGAAAVTVVSLSDLIVSVGIDSTSTNHPDTIVGRTEGSNSTGANVSVQANWSGYPGLGRHTLVWLEEAGAGTNTWIGDAGVTKWQTGMIGEVMA